MSGLYFILAMERDEFVPAVTKSWLDFGPPLPAGTAILARAQEMRAQINAAVCLGLENESVLHGPVLKAERYLAPGCPVRRETAKLNRVEPHDWFKAALVSCAPVSALSIDRLGEPMLRENFDHGLPESDLEPHEPRLFRMLGEILSEEDDLSRGLFTVVVVHGK